MSWTVLVPSSLAALGSVCLGMAVVLSLLPLPGKVPWGKIGGWFALLGGFGALGGAGGWLGSQILSGSERAMGFGMQYGSQLIGNGIIIVLLLTVGLWSYKAVFGSGLDAGGKGGGGKKLRALFKGGLIALSGATIAAVLPPLYSGIDWLVSGAHSLIV